MRFFFLFTYFWGAQELLKERLTIVKDEGIIGGGMQRCTRSAKQQGQCDKQSKRQRRIPID
jgi:hypothetical protein